MVHIELKNKIEKSHEDEKKRKTIVLGEVSNGWILIKRIQKKDEEGNLDMDNEEETVMVYRENPLNMEKDENEFDSESVTNFIDKMMP